VNIGTLGYLADVERNDAQEAIEKVLDYDYKIEKRMMLEAFVEGKDGVRDKFFVLNEVVVSSSVFSKMIEIKTEVNGDFLDSYRADGIIVATPTGSTAYNLSAGGPILKPDTELTAITYVCPHALFSRPFVVSGNDVIRLSFKDDCDNAVATFDGQKRATIGRGETVVIKKADYYTNIIRTSGLSFYDILRSKMVEVRK
ncbi:MAG: NAD(+)/NADH kinase, partial [Firmicutes bacterium]|nr:NAD(+)/NADH kinase [Bacillota bacterium]